MILVSVHLEIVLILTQDRCTVWPNIARKSFYTHLMVLLGDEAQVDACFGPFVDSANLDVRLLHGLCRTYNRLRNHFVRTLWCM
jgi:hypothetical protein